MSPGDQTPERTQRTTQVDIKTWWSDSNANTVKYTIQHHTRRTTQLSVHAEAPVMLTTQTPCCATLSGFNTAPVGFGVTNWLKNFCSRMVHKNRSPSDIILYAHGMPLVQSRCLFEPRYCKLGRETVSKCWTLAEQQREACDLASAITQYRRVTSVMKTIEKTSAKWSTIRVALMVDWVVQG